MSNDKHVWQIVIICGLVLLSAYLLDSKINADKKAEKAVADALLANENYQLFKKGAEDHIANLMSQVSVANAAIAVKDRKILDLTQKQLQTLDSLAVEQAKTKSLSPNGIVVEISTYVGPEVRLTGVLSYDFTRKGAEKTLNIFYAEKYAQQSLVIQRDVTQQWVEKFNLSQSNVDKLQGALTIKIEELAYSESATAAALNGMDALQKANKKAKWVKRAEGFGIGVVTVMVLHAIFGK